MTPDELAKSGTEHAHQRALFAWANMAARYGVEAANDPACYGKGGKEYAELRYAFGSIPALDELYAIPNGGERHGAVAGKLKAEGVKPGTPDTHLPVACGKYHSLYIEMKKPGGEKKKSGACNDAQKKRFPRLLSYGNAVVVCYTWQQAARTLLTYLSGQPIPLALSR